jgi:uncharacterized coiled-coil protein SlyX
MKKLTAIVLGLAILAMMELGGCSEERVSPNEAVLDITVVSPSVGEESTFKTLENTITKDFESTISDLEERYVSLSTTITTINSYVFNKQSVFDYYSQIVTDIKSLSLRLCDYSIDYVELMLTVDSLDMNSSFEQLCDRLGNSISERVYDGVLSNMNEHFYSGILSAQSDDIDENEWTTLRSEENKLWSDVRSEIEEGWSDCRSIISEFQSEVKTAFQENNTERIDELIQDFQTIIEKSRS